MDLEAIKENREVSTAPSFRKWFCEHYGCPHKDFEVYALRLFLYRPWGVIARLGGAFFFKTDLKILTRLGSIENWNILVTEARSIRTDYQRERDFGFMRRNLRRRLSSRIILDVGLRIWGNNRTQT